ncbi:MAG: tryptophan--tRNA ligase [Candidatus Magasanikbacteria bacterium]|nr:tryptophan--tRNA ligase [Candidatus Magasanikbacteria bacterium]
MAKPIIISGIQPTGNLHIGNYLGAVKNWVELQNSGKYEMYIFIADLHSLTGNMSALDRREQIIRTAVELMAAGINPEKTVFFVQSHITEHSELAWIFNCVCPISELERMTQFKDKSERQVKNINTGLLTYPILQAADILMYKAAKVPVGQDQIQHIELTRDIARWFNNRFEDYFPETEPLLTETPKVMSLLEPAKKMSKSLGEGHVIELADEPKVIEKKIKKAVTATEGGGEAPGVANLLLFLKNFADKSVYDQFVEEEKTGKIQYGDLKKQVSDSISSYFQNFRDIREELMLDHDKIAETLIVGAEKASAVAKKTMEDVRRMVGVR